MSSAGIGSSHPICQTVQSSTEVTVFCDFDGPIMDVSDRYYSTYKRALDALAALQEVDGVPVRIQLLSKEQFWQMKQDRIADVEIAMRSGLSGTQIDRFLVCVQQIVNQSDLLAQDKLQVGVKWALTLLHTKGIRLVLVTLRQQQQVLDLLKNHGLLHLFSDVWGANDEAAAYANQASHKSHLLTQALKSTHRTSTQPLVSWMIGDTEADILAGQAAQVPTLALTCGIRSHSYLEKYQPTRIHSDLLAAADHIVQYLDRVQPCCA